MPKLRELLRSLPVFAGELPEFELGSAPAEPFSLFTEWLTDAAPDWTLYTLRPDEVEFFQGDADRRHTRLRYLPARPDNGRWSSCGPERTRGSG